MTIAYRKFHGKSVSKKWWVVLTHLERVGFEFTLNSGHRTMREQLSLFRQNMHLVNGRWVPRPAHALTAKPLPTAPHIRTGRADHALDIAAPGVNKLVHHLRTQHAANVRFTVSGEPWHIEIDNSDLTRLWRELR